MAEATAADSASLETGSAALKRAIRRVERRKQFASAALIAPLFLFLAITFVMPIGLMLYRAVENPEIVDHLPRTAEAIESWDGEALPGEALYAKLGRDMVEAYYDRALAAPARRLNYELDGFRSTFMATARELPRERPEGGWKQAFLEADPVWGELRTWKAIQVTAKAYTAHYLLTALDLERTFDYQIRTAPADEAIFLDIYQRTFWMAFVITAAALAMGYPLAYLMANGHPAVRAGLLLFVLLPFWTSLLARTSAWVVLLQQEGLVNEALQILGLVDQPLELLYNRFGVYVGMIHILLPFMVMPIYAVMRGVPQSHLRAALGLGATPFTAFRRVYLPQTVSGIGAGCLLVFILSVGFYITPALLGSPKDQLVSYFIAFYTNQTINWGLASALGVILLICIFVLYAVFNRLVGLSRPQLS
jgi:putative spermidine/putrescine transport system permease protein